MVQANSLNLSESTTVCITSHVTFSQKRSSRICSTYRIKVNVGYTCTRKSCSSHKGFTCGWLQTPSVINAHWAHVGFLCFDCKVIIIKVIGLFSQRNSFVQQPLVVNKIHFQHDKYYSKICLKQPLKRGP